MFLIWPALLVWGNITSPQTGHRSYERRVVGSTEENREVEKKCKEAWAKEANLHCEKNTPITAYNESRVTDVLKFEEFMKFA